MRFRSAADVIFAEARAVGPLTVRQPLPSEQPFVMNTEDEIRQAYADYQRTGFGGWPWKSPDPIHGAAGKRFARLIDGKKETPA